MQSPFQPIHPTPAVFGNYYWFVGGSTTLVFGSAALSYVPLADATFQAWLARGNLPGLASAAIVARTLVTSLLPSSVAITSTATPALNGDYAIDDNAQQTIVALSTGIAAGKPLPGGAATFNFADATGAQHAFTGPQFLDFAAAVENFIYAAQQAIIAAVGGTPTALPSRALAIT